MIFKISKFIVLSFCFFFQATAWGQDDEGEVFNAAFEFGAHLGNILPNQVPGATEIHPQWGLRTGFGAGGGATYEITANSGKGNGVDWTQLSASLRLDMPIESLVGIVYFGGDATYYKGVGMSKKVFGGGHVGGGILSIISRDLWFRADMRFNVNPGTSLLISGGFLFRFGGSDSDN